MTYFFTVFTALLSLVFVTGQAFAATGTGGGGGAGGAATNAINTVDTGQFTLTKSGSTWTITVKNGAPFTNLVLRAASLPTATASRAVILTSDGYLTNSPTTDTEIGYISGLSGPIGPLFVSKLTVDSGIDFPHTIASALTFNNDQTVNGNLTLSGGQTNGGAMKASTYYGDGSHLTGIAGGGSQTPLTGDVNGTAAFGVTNLSQLTLSQSPSNQVQLTMRPGLSTIPIPIMRPLSNNSSFRFDLAPRGTPDLTGQPIGFDICAADPDATNNFAYMRVGTEGLAGFLDSQIVGSATAMSLQFKIGGTAMQTINNTGTMEFRNAIAGQNYWRFGSTGAGASAFAQVIISQGLASDLLAESYNASHATLPGWQFLHADAAPGLLIGADAGTGAIRFLAGGATLANTFAYVTNGGTVIQKGFFVVGPSGAAITNILSATATLDFPSTAAQSSSDLPVTLSGCADGDVVKIGVPSASLLPNSCYSGFCSNAQAFVRFINYSTGAQNPASGSFKIVVTKF